MNASELVRLSLNALAATYEFDLLGNQADPVAELVYIILSTRTQGVTFSRTYSALRTRYRDWAAVAHASTEELQKLLGAGGLQTKKAAWLKAALEEVERREGRVDLSRLAALNDQDAEDYLKSLPGIGIKSARCILMYSLDRDVLPVDANLFRLLKRLGLVPGDLPYRRCHDVVQQLVPPELRRDFHVFAIIHGRATCLPRAPRCSGCCLVEWCPTFSSDAGATDQAG